MMTKQNDISNKLEGQAPSENGAELDSQECRNRGGTQPNKRLNKLRSIKLSKLRSFRQSRRSANSRSDRVSSILSGDLATPQKLSPIPVLDASPHYMKATSCSSARKENFQASPRNSESSFGSGYSNLLKPNAALLGQKSARALTKRSSFKPIKGLTRMSSLRSKRPQMKKYSGAAEMKRKLKKSRSIKLAGFDSLRLPTGRANKQYDRPSSASDQSKLHCHASPRNSESGFNSNGHRKNWIVMNPNSGFGQKSLMRKSSLRPVRILTKMSSLKPRRPKHDRDTCSSTLKSSRFSHHVELHPGGSESERTSVMKVCPYKYCSLNGHFHAPLTPLKPFLLRRRRLLKTQKTMKRHFTDLEKDIQAYKMAFIIDSTAEQSGEEFFVEIYDKPKSESAGEVGTHGADAEGKGDSGILAEVLLGETSHPQMDVEENPSALDDFRVANCSIEKESDGLFSEVRDGKEETIVASNLDNESYNSNVIDDQPDSDVACFLEGEELGLCNKLSSTLDDPESTSHEEVALSGNVPQGAHGEFVSNLNSEFNEGDDLAGATGDDSKSTTFNGVVSSAPACAPSEKLTEGSEEKHGAPEPDQGSFRGCPPAGDTELPCNTDEAIERQLENQKFIRMWCLIYKRVVSGTAAMVGTQVSVDGAEREKQQDDADTLVNGDACQDFPKDSDAGCQRIELRQIDAIRLVEEAIDGIPLPETQDNSSDDNLVTSDTISDQEFSEKNPGKDNELSFPASCSPGEDGFRDPEQTLVKDDSATIQVNEKTNFKGGDKPVNEMRKSWSNLQKVILLRKFIKAVEKVRKFNPREPRYLPLESKSEAEKIYLRHQEMYGRKNAEEWMLDYALQQVVSKLTPARRRKVALLVEAFEAISPLQDIESPLKPTQAAPFHAKLVQASSSSLHPCGEETGKGMRLRECAEQTGHSLTVAENIPVVQKTKPDCSCAGTELGKSISVAADEKAKEIGASSLDNGEDNSTVNAEQPDFDGSCLSLDGEVVQEVHGETISSLKSEPYNGNSEENGKNLEIGSLIDESAGIDSSSIKEDSDGWTAINKVVSSASIGDPLEVQHVGYEKINGRLDPDYGCRQGNPLSGGSEPETNGAAAHRNQMDKQRSNRMWYLIYQHMLSGVGANVEIRPSLDEAKETLRQGASETDPSKGMENHDAGCEDTELRQSDAIKLVQEAIDQLLTPQSEDHSLNNPITAEQEEVIGDKERSREADKVKVNHGKTEVEDEKTVISEVGKKSNYSVVSKNWNHLKKLVLLKRFVKSLEKVKKFNPRGPRFLEMETDPEAEKVRLRHQTTEDRKNSEEWMLDYALQQVVTKLSPARRRRVELLVEAFETVTPPSHFEAPKRRTQCRMPAVSAFCT